MKRKKIKISNRFQLEFDCMLVPLRVLFILPALKITWNDKWIDVKYWQLSFMFLKFYASIELQDFKSFNKWHLKK